jgi:acyl-CoA dehydrogenase
VTSGVLNGEKTYISGTGDPRCKIMICIVNTDPDAGPYQQHFQILVPMDVEGLEILRPKMVFSLDDAPHGHMHLRFTNVRVPKENMILGRGRGFEISQGRLGPGRIHHCMRAIGMAERALGMLCKRAESRVAFGKALFRLGATGNITADARMNIDMARLLTLKTAHVIDSAGVREAQTWISKIKVVVPNVTL